MMEWWNDETMGAMDWWNIGTMEYQTYLITSALMINLDKSLVNKVLPRREVEYSKAKCVRYPGRLYSKPEAEALGPGERSDALG
ncbi:MAG: hypothetical protein ACRD4E_15915, partial [Bryobacteraceae bacterium]